MMPKSPADYICQIEETADSAAKLRAHRPAVSKVVLYYAYNLIQHYLIM